MLAAAATATAPWVPRRWRRLTWTLVIATAVARFVTAPTSFDSAIALLVGWVAGSLALVVAGGPVRRPTDAAVAEGLAAVGVPVSSITKASVDARGSTPYFASTTEGERLFVKALGADERSADLLFRAYRRVTPHDLGDERSFSSLRRTVEHEALVALTARDLGVRTPRFRAFGRVEPDAFVLAYEGIDGSSLDGVEADKFDDALLASIWEQVAVLRRHRIAHRDLRLANVFRASDGQVWLIDFGFSELAASDLLLSTDLAELLASTSLVVGCDRAVAAGVAAVAPEPLARAASRLHPFALSGATRAGLKEQPGLLDAVRSRVEDLAADLVS
jgi:undecaprenyl-diphosphatase